MMKLHVLQHISKSPLHQPGGLSAWPVHLIGHAVSEAMLEVVAAVAFDGHDEMLPDSSRLLYFSKRRNNGGGFLSEEVWQLAGRSMSCELIVFTEGRAAGREPQ
jgi:hypothetical protein